MVLSSHRCLDRAASRPLGSQIRRQQYVSSVSCTHAVSPHVSSAQGDVQSLGSSIHALKEWSITVSAILGGRQQVLLRRGGIREGAFKCGVEPFVLFPTGYHSDPNLCKPGTALPYHENLDWDPKYSDSIPIHGMAQVEDQFTTMNADVFQMLQDLHIWTDSFNESRLGRRRSQPITAMFLKAWRFHEPVILPQSDSHWGCFSWLNLQSDDFVDAFDTAQLVQPVEMRSTATRIFEEAKLACSNG